MLEQRGKVFDALPLYKKALQIVPDIEYKMMMHEMHPVKDKDTPDRQLASSTASSSQSKQEKEVPEIADLYPRFWEAIQLRGKWCEDNLSSLGVISTASAHISDLPLEVFLIICRWIVSNELDVRSLERSALVCKGFYLCARDPELWRLICLKVWGVQLGTLQGSSYPSWRQMFFERSRLRFDGCYISKTSYFRYGENSFQDQSYKPVHHVEYYRYLRFYADGVVLMQTSADEPVIGVKKLTIKGAKGKKEILSGFYRLHGDTVMIMLQRRKVYEVPTISEKRSRRANPAEMVYEQTFHIELKIASSRHRKFNTLHWNQYRIVERRNCLASDSEFPLNNAQYPSLVFSRVEHYSQVSNAILSLNG